MTGDFYKFSEVAILIASYCRENQINESDYAALIGVQPPSLSRIKAGKGCSLETLAKIAALAQISVKDLMNESPASIKHELEVTGRLKNLPVTI